MLIRLPWRAFAVPFSCPDYRFSLDSAAEMPSLKAVAVGVGLVAAALVADRVSQVWASLLESNVLIFIFVGLLLAVALYSTGTNGQAFGGSTGATTSQQIVPRRPHLGSSSTSGNANSPVQTPRRPTETAQRSRRRVITDVPSFMQPSGSGGSINASAGSNANDAALVASGSTGGGGGSSNTALVAVDDLSNALVESEHVLAAGCLFVGARSETLSVFGSGIPFPVMCLLSVQAPACPAPRRTAAASGTPAPTWAAAGCAARSTATTWRPPMAGALQLLWWSHLCQE